MTPPNDLPAPADYELTWNDVALLANELPFDKAVARVCRHTYCREEVAKAWLNHLKKHGGLQLR